MAVNQGEHWTVVEMVDETNEGGQINYYWSCLCRRVGQRTGSPVAADKAGKAHERRYAPRRSGAARLINDAIGLSF